MENDTTSPTPWNSIDLICYLWTVLGTLLASLASPQPRSAMTRLSSCLRMSVMMVLRGSSGHMAAWCWYPWWYELKRVGSDLKSFTLALPERTFQYLQSDDNKYLLSCV